MKLGLILSKKLNAAKKDTVLFIPLKGVSLIDSPGKPFYGKEEDLVLFNTLRNNVDLNRVEIIEMENEINDEAFALAMAKKLHEMIQSS